MASTIAGASLSTPRAIAKTSSSNSPTLQTIKSPWLSQPCKTPTHFWSGRILVRPVSVSPDLSKKVADSIKEAEEACAGDPVSGECKAAWDEVEELSAAVSHAKDKEKESDPLEDFCKDNMETDECRTYDN